MDIRQLTRTLLVKQADTPAPVVPPVQPIKPLPAVTPAPGPVTPPAQPPPPAAPAGPGLASQALSGAKGLVDKYLTVQPPEAAPRAPTQGKAYFSRGGMSNDYWSDLARAKQENNIPEIQRITNQIPTGAVQSNATRMATMQVLGEAPEGVDPSQDPLAGIRNQVSSGLNRQSVVQPAAPGDKEDLIREQADQAAYNQAHIDQLRSAAAAQVNQQVSRLAPAIQERVRAGIPAVSVMGHDLTPAVPGVGQNPAEIEQSLRQNPGLVDAAASTGQIPPGQAAELKAVMGHDQTAQGKLLQAKTQEAAQRVGTNLVKSMQMGPDGKPAHPDIMGAIMSDPMSLMAPAGLLLMLVGGDMGKLLGGLMLAGGGYRLWSRFSNATEQGPKLYQELRAKGVKDFSYKGLEAAGVDPSRAQPTADFVNLGLLAGQESMNQHVAQQAQQMGNQFISPQQQAAQQATDAQIAQQVKATSGAPQ